VLSELSGTLTHGQLPQSLSQVLRRRSVQALRAHEINDDVDRLLHLRPDSQRLAELAQPSPFFIQSLPPAVLEDVQTGIIDDRQCFGSPGAQCPKNHEACLLPL